MSAGSDAPKQALAQATRWFFLVGAAMLSTHIDQFVAKHQGLPFGARPVTLVAVFLVLTWLGLVPKLRSLRSSPAALELDPGVRTIGLLWLALPLVGLAAFLVSGAERNGAAAGSLLWLGIGSATVVTSYAATRWLGSPKIDAWWAGLAGGLLLASILVDVVRPGTFSKQMSRAAGTVMEANGAAFVLLLLAAFLLRWDRVRTSSVVVLTLAGVGVLCTLTRSGTVAFALLVLGFAVLAGNGENPLSWRRRLGRLATAAVVLVGAIWTFQAVAREIPGTFQKAAARGRLDMAAGRQDPTKNWAVRIEVAKESLAAVEASPIAGQGPGTTRSFKRRAHNLYLEIWVELGLAGLAAYLLILALTGWRLVRHPPRGTLLVLTVIIFWGFWSHTVLTTRAALLVLGALLGRVDRTPA